MAAAAKNSNQRSWKNFLLNKRYQLRFALFMTGLSALLMGLLGWWVKSQASKATEIAINNVYGSADLMQCEQPDISGLGVSAPAPDWIDEGAARTGAEAPAVADDDEPATAAGEPTGEGEPEESDLEGAHPAADDPLAWDEGADEDETSRIVLGDIEGEITAAEGATSDVSAADVGAYYECRMEQAIELSGLVGPIYRGERLITIVLVLVGVLLLVGITLYGIVMTHRVAGPLYKITLYLNKLRDGRYDTVYNLRKGDHLVEFYEHFKRAHAGLRAMQEEDLARLREAVALADREGLAERSPELAEIIEEMRSLAEKKETSLE